MKKPTAIILILAVFVTVWTMGQCPCAFAGEAQFQAKESSHCQSEGKQAASEQASCEHLCHLEFASPKQNVEVFKSDITAAFNLNLFQAADLPVTSSAMMEHRDLAESPPDPSRPIYVLFQSLLI